ncbi:hypothetical protein PQ610_06590 [Tardisphaera miroshnichenkoae]
MTVYSYYDGKVRERLRDHVSLAIRSLESGSRLEKVGLSFFPTFRRAFEVSVLFHDFGKAFYNVVAFDDKKPLSFNGHEVISAWAVNRFLWELRDLQPLEEAIEPREIRMTVLAVMLHHHAMGLESRIEHLQKSSLASESVDMRTWSAFFDEMSGKADEDKPAAGSSFDLRSFISRRFGVDASTLEKVEKACSAEKASLSELVMESTALFKEYKNKIWDEVGSASQRALLALLQGLVAADYISAGQGRKRSDDGIMSDFERMIEQFRVIYMQREAK